MYGSEEVSERDTESSTNHDADVDAISQGKQHEDPQVGTLPLSNKGGAKRISEPPVPWVLLIQAPD